MKKNTCWINCDYCGGYEGLLAKGDKRESISPVEIGAPGLKVKRVFCVPCWIKVFDKVLGKPKKPKNNTK